MKTNIGITDKITRMMIAVAIAILFLTNQISGALAILPLGLAAAFLLTSMINFCPLYLPFGLSTIKKKK